MSHIYWLKKISLITILVIGQTYVLAAPPKKPNMGLFTKLVSSSPFTIKPEKEVAVQESPLERDWSLASISPSGKGYSVTLMNKKNRKDRIRFIPGFSAGEYKLLEVKQDAKSRKNSKVYVQKGSQKAWISYDEKALQLKPNKPQIKRPKITSKQPTVPTPQGGANNTKSAESETKPTVPRRRVRRVPLKK